MTASLLQSIAFQMRTLRRKGVSASFEGIFLFYIAFAVSVVLAFADIGERTTAHSLVFGMLISWFPLLLLFAILDRNPIFAGRSRDLISRWMWNVRAVKEWRAEADLKSPHSGGRRTARMSRSRSLILLVRGARLGTMVSLSQSWTALRQQQHQQQHPRLPTPQMPSGTPYAGPSGRDIPKDSRPGSELWPTGCLVGVGHALVCHRIGRNRCGVDDLNQDPNFRRGLPLSVVSHLRGPQHLPMLMQLLLNWWTGTGKHLMLRVWVRRLSDTLCFLAVGTLVFVTFAAVSTYWGWLTYLTVSYSLIQADD